ncbi:MAG: riboflavin kinase, partial [Muribaculaceae bacterium]|nr:riboflavin kinase [Muribaculaceae bacterium]
IRLEFVDRLRDEMKFGSVAELVGQLEKDKEDTLNRVNRDEWIKK